MKKAKSIYSNKLFLMISAIAFWAMRIQPDIFTVAIIGILSLVSALWIFVKKDISFENGHKVASLLAVVFATFFSIGFYEHWVPSSKLQFIAEKIGMNSQIMLLVITVAAVLIALPFSFLLFNTVVNKTISVIKRSSAYEQMRVIFKNIPALKKSLFILFAILLFAMIAIIRADINYTDDIGRVQSGYINWQNYCRYVSSFLCRFIHADTYLNDVSPFPQILAVLVMAVAGVITLNIFTGKTSFNVWEYASVIPLCISPYFLGCLAFKYDSPYMALSVLFSIIPFLFRNIKLPYYSFISFVMLLLMCMSYQASSGIYVVFVIFLAFKDWNTKEKSTKDIVKWLAVSAASFLCAMIVFKVIFNSFAYSPRSTEMFSINEMAGGVINNITTYFELMLEDCKTSWIVLIGLICIGYSISMSSASKQKKPLAFVLSVAVIAVSAIFSFGAYLFLKDAATMPRYMYGIFACISVAAINGVSLNMNISKVSGFILGASFIIFSLAFGNAMSEQKEYEDFRLNMVAEELRDLDCVQSYESVYIKTVVESVYSEPVNNTPHILMKKLVDQGFWSYRLAYYYRIDNLQDDISKTDYSQFDLTTVSENSYYKIEVYEQYVLVTLK